MNINDQAPPQQKIKRYRQRQVSARLESMLNRTGSNCVLINLPDGTMATVEVTRESLRDALKYFEGMVYGEYSRSEAEEHILKLYTSNLTKHGDKLTEEGNVFINEIIKQTVVMAEEQGMGEEVINEK